MAWYRRAPLLTVSLTAHAALLVGLVVSSSWKIEKLRADSGPLALAVMRPPASGGGPAAGAAPAAVAKRTPRRIIKELRQPTVVPPVEPAVVPAVASTEPGVGTGAGTGGGGDGTVGDGTGDGPPCVAPACCEGPACGSGDGPPEPPQAPKVVAPQLVAPHTMRAMRIAGDDQLMPPDPVKITMRHAGQARLTASIKVCVDTRGVPSSVSVIASSGYPAYDQELLRGVRAWRYRPYLIDHQPAPVCASVQFIYRMT